MAVSAVYCNVEMNSDDLKVEYQTTFRPAIRPRITAEYQIFFEYRGEVELFAEVFSTVMIQNLIDRIPKTSKIKISYRLDIVVCCCKLNNTWDCDEHLFGQVSTCTDHYLFHQRTSEIICCI